MNKTMFEEIDKYLAQIQDFLKNNQEMTDVFIIARKTRKGDRFIIEFNEKTIGALILMITENETLSTLAQFAILHKMALQSEEEIEEHFDMLKNLSLDLHREISSEKNIRVVTHKHNSNLS